MPDSLLVAARWIMLIVSTVAALYGSLGVVIGTFLIARRHPDFTRHHLVEYRRFWISLAAGICGVLIFRPNE